MKKRSLLKTMLLLCALVAGGQSVWADDYYVKVTDSNQLVDGATYIIGDVSNTTAYAFVEINNKSKGTTVTSGLTVIGNAIKVASSAETKPCEFILNSTSTAGDFTFKISGGNYLGYNSGTNYTSAATLPTGNGLAKYQWTISYNSTYSCFTIVNVGSTDRVMLRKNDANPNVYGPYSTTNLSNSSYNIATIYKKVTATFTTADYAAFSCPAITNFNGIATVYKAKVNGGSVTLTAIADGIVPANQGVILYKDVDEKTTVSVPVAAAAGAGVFTDNELHVSNGTVTGDGSTIYALASKGEPAVVGFYLVKSGVKVPAGKPYLEITGAGSAPEFLGFSFGETTGVSQIENRELRIENFFDLQGRRVAQPKKGLYIVNGKKVVIK